jgi:hypothetical protein
MVNITKIIQVPGVHFGNAEDDRDCLPTIDRWLEGGITHGLEAVVQQQRWGDDALTVLKAAWKDRTGLEPGSGYIDRGHGWRAWYEDGTPVDSTMMEYRLVREPIVLAVS